MNTDQSSYPEHRLESSSQQINIPNSTEVSNSQKLDATKSIITWLLVFLIILLIGTTSVFAYKYYGLKKQIDTLQIKNLPHQPEEIPLPSTTQAEGFNTYSNEKYQFSFKYPKNWQINKTQGQDDTVSFSNIANGHNITISVWRVTGFGYCYKYGERKEINVAGRKAETADGVGGSEACDEPEKYANLGNTFVLIPIENEDIYPIKTQIHISYDYPLADKNLAKSNLDLILSNFRFVNVNP